VRKCKVCYAVESPRTRSQALHVSEFTISQDVTFLKQHARDYIKNFDEHFAAEYKQCLDFISQVMLESWTSAKTCKYERHKPQFLNTTKDCLLIKSQLLCDVNLIDRTVSFVEGIKKEKRQLVAQRASLEDNTLEDLVSTSTASTPNDYDLEEDTEKEEETETQVEKQGF
jgi:hypothetical protein